MSEDYLVGQLLGLTDMVCVIAKTLESQSATKSVLHTHLNEQIENTMRTANNSARIDTLKEIQARLGLCP